MEGKADTDRTLPETGTGTDRPGITKTQRMPHGIARLKIIINQLIRNNYRSTETIPAKAFYPRE